MTAEIFFLDPDRRRFQAKNLFFIHTLVTLHNMGCRDIRKKNVMVQDGWNQRLTNFFLQRYTKVRTLVLRKPQSSMIVLMSRT